MEKTKILIVEDESIFALETEKALKGLGYQVVSIVDSGVKAIEATKMEKPDIVLMDIRINGEMDGIATAEIIRTQFEVPIVFMTAYLDEKRLERAKLTMPFGCILKPVQGRDLKVAIEMALHISKVDAERRRAEQALRESERKYRNILESIEDGYVEHDSKGNHVFFNDSYCRIIGYSRDELQGKNYRKFHHVESGNNVFEFYNKVYETGESGKIIDWDFTKKNGEKIFLESSVSPIKDDDGKPVGFRSVVRDITEKTKNEQALKESEE